MHAYHQICVVYDCDSIKVYQAYNPEIAQLAIQHQKFVSPSLFKEWHGSNRLFYGWWGVSLGKQTQSKSCFSDLYTAWFLGILIAIKHSYWPNTCYSSKCHNFDAQEYKYAEKLFSKRADLPLKWSAKTAFADCLIEWVF